jgi:enoyl-CoA hydratase
MTTTYVEFERKEKLIILKLDNPPVNSLNLSLMDQLSETLAQIERDETIRVVIITGKGKFFAAGGDIQELEKVSNSSEGVRLSEHIQSVFKKIETFPRPIIAAINGVCLGGGLELALACHLRIADEEVLLGLPEINLALIPGGGGTQRLSRLVGRAKAYEMILSGESVDAKEAYRIGLVNVVTPKGECMAHAEKYGQKVSRKAPPAIAAAVKAIQASRGGDGEEGMRKESDLFGHLFETPEKAEGLKAFLEKRKPNFDA